MTKVVVLVLFAWMDSQVGARAMAGFTDESQCHAAGRIMVKQAPAKKDVTYTYQCIVNPRTKGLDI